MGIDQSMKILILFAKSIAIALIALVLMFSIYRLVFGFYPGEFDGKVIQILGTGAGLVYYFRIVAKRRLKK